MSSKTSAGLYQKQKTPEMHVLSQRFSSKWWTTKSKKKQERKQLRQLMCWLLQELSDWASQGNIKTQNKPQYSWSVQVLFCFIVLPSSSRPHNTVAWTQESPHRQRGPWSNYSRMIGPFCPRLAVKKSCLPQDFGESGTHRKSPNSGFVVPQKWHMYCIITAA